MKKYLIAFIILFSGSTLADEIPEIVKQDPNTLEWNWTYYSKHAEKPVGYLADFTKQEKISDGTIFLPWAGWDFKSNKFVFATHWSRINCKNNSIDSPGIFDKGLFSAQNPTVFGEDSIGAIPKHMICGITTQDGDRVFGLLAIVNETSLTWWGWMPDKIKKEDIQDSLIKFNLYQYDVIGKQKGFLYSYSADCANKKLIPSKNLPALDLADRKNASLLYTYNSVCALKDKLLKESSSTEAKTTVQKINEPATPEVTAPKISIEEAKVKCTGLGFKPKTEKFGNCVLELIK